MPVRRYDCVCLYSLVYFTLIFIAYTQNYKPFTVYETYGYILL